MARDKKLIQIPADQQQKPKPAEAPQDRTGLQPNDVPGRTYGFATTPEEALLSVQPYFDYLKKNYPGAIYKKSRALAVGGSLAQFAGLYNMLNKLSGGKIGSGLGGLLGNFISSFNQPNSNLESGANAVSPDLNFNLSAVENFQPGNISGEGSDWQLENALPGGSNLDFSPASEVPEVSPDMQFDPNLDFSSGQ